jgi:hypothetical protein
MTDSEGTPQETEIGPEPSAGEAATNVDLVDQEAPSAGEATEATADGDLEAKKKGLTAGYQIEGEKAGADDYQTRLEKFDNVDTPVPVVSLPVETPNQEKSAEV